jgi:hypothetical protein
MARLEQEPALIRQIEQTPAGVRLALGLWAALWKHINAYTNFFPCHFRSCVALVARRPLDALRDDHTALRWVRAHIASIFGDQATAEQIAGIFYSAVPEGMSLGEVKARAGLLARNLPTKAEGQQLLQEYIAAEMARLEATLPTVESTADRNLELDMEAAGMEDTPEGARLAQQVQASYRASDYALRRLDLLQNPRQRGAKRREGQAPPDPPTPGPGAGTAAEPGSARSPTHATPSDGAAAAALHGESLVGDGQDDHGVDAAESSTPRFEEPPVAAGAVASTGPLQPPQTADVVSASQEPRPADSAKLTSEAISSGAAVAESSTPPFEEPTEAAGAVASPTPPQPPQPADVVSNSQEPQPADSAKLTSEAISSGVGVAESSTPRFEEPTDAREVAASQAPTHLARTADLASNNQEPGPACCEKLTTEAIFGDTDPVDPTGTAASVGREWASETSPDPLAGAGSRPCSAKKLTTEAILAREAAEPGATEPADPSCPAEPVVVPEGSWIQMLFPDALLPDCSRAWRRAGPVRHGHDAGVVRSPPAG